MNRFFFKVYFLVIFGLIQGSNAYAQVTPVSLDERIFHADHIVIGQVVSKHGFWDKVHERLNTLNVINIKATVKGEYQQQTIAYITEGGILNLEAVHVCPSDELAVGEEYMLFLNNADLARTDREFAVASERTLQTTSYYVHAGLPFYDGLYKDMFEQFSMTESELLSYLKTNHQLVPRTIDGKLYRPRTYNPVSFVGSRVINSLTDGSGSPPAATGFIAGTIVANNEIIIIGTGFGSAVGTIEFANADSPTLFVSLTNATDLISWTNTQIRAKIPRRAGTGTMNVKVGTTVVGTASVTIAWSEICLDAQARTATCTATGGNVRHRIELANQNGSGGYTLRFNDGSNGAAASFSANSAAKDAFSRALSTWRCASLVNYDISNTSTNVAYAAGDGNSVVLFDNTLAANVLANCVSSFSGGCGSMCTNGIRWFVTDIDVRVKTIPLANYTWNYAIGNPLSTQFDFETVMLHELGHGHGLGHVIDATKVMHYAVTNGVTNRVLSTQDISGALFRVAHSTGTQCVGSPMITPSLANPTITAPTVTQPSCSSPTGTIVVNATGIGALEYSVNNGASFQSSNTFNGLVAGTYNIKVRNISCNSFIRTYASNPVTIIAYNFTPTSIDTWTGCASNEWNNPGNWMDGSVPTSSDSVTIPNLANDPVVSTVVTLKNLTLQSGVVVTVTSSGLLTLTQ
jgi:hypothetical protein